MSPEAPPFQRTVHHGFTLVELLVAVAILGVICVMAFSLVDRSTNLWTNAEGREEGFREARAAIHNFSRDLKNALPDATNTNWFYSTSNRIAFLTTIPQQAQRWGTDRSDICAVGYSLEWGKSDETNSQELPRYSLYRYVRFANPAFERNIAANNKVSDVFDSDGSNTVRELVARNISNFRCDLYMTNTAGDLQPFVQSSASVFPDVISFSLSTIDQKTAAKLSSASDWADTNAPAFKQSEQTFSLRFRPIKRFSIPITP